MGQTIQYNGRDIPVLGSWDTVVVGGGPGGASAGITSTKGGCSTLIVDKNIRLGGTASNALVCPMMKSFTGHHSNFFDIEAELQRLGFPTRDEVVGEVLWFTPEALAQALENLYTQAGGDILYDAVLSDCILESGKLRYLILTTVEGLCAVGGSQFVDASGDAALIRAAGVPAEHGDENGNNQISSLRFEMGGIDVEAYRAYLIKLKDDFSEYPWGFFHESAMVAGRNFVLEPLFQKAVADGVLLPQDLRYFQTFSIPNQPGCLSFNCPHLASLTNNSKAMSRSRAVLEGHAMIQRLVRFLTSYMPGFERAYLLRAASMLGIRESWRMVGKYVMTENDYLGKARFLDGVARGDWYIDVHSATKGLFHQKAYEKGDYYEIPLRSMVCDQVSNLIVAGRCISTTFLMQASIRIIATCLDMGQAAGEACIYAKNTGTELNAIDGAVIREKMDYRFKLPEKET